MQHPPLLCLLLAGAPLAQDPVSQPVRPVPSNALDFTIFAALGVPGDHDWT